MSNSNSSKNTRFIVVIRENCGVKIFAANDPRKAKSYSRQTNVTVVDTKEMTVTDNITGSILSTPLKIVTRVNYEKIQADS